MPHLSATLCFAYGKDAPDMEFCALGKAQENSPLAITLLFLLTFFYLFRSFSGALLGPEFLALTGGSWANIIPNSNSFSPCFKGC